MKPDGNSPTAVIVNNPMNPSGRLESAWRAGNQLRVEQFLETYSEWEMSPEQLLELVLTEIRLRRHHGFEVLRDDYLSRFPHLQQSLLDYFQRQSTQTGNPLQASSSVDRNPPQIPGYEIQKEIGRGGMGVVYKAIQTNLNRPVALKVILSGRFASKEDQERFRREAEVIATLKNPGIVQIYQVGETNGFPFCALEYIEGGTLADLIKPNRLPPRQGAEIAMKIAQGAHHAHENGIIHRDLKPANILLQSEGSKWQPKITDFGIAKRLLDQSNLTGTGMAAGTPQYMAPEQALANKEIPVGPAADIYAIGVILYEMLTQQVPFTANNPMEIMKRVVNETPRPLTKISQISPGIWKPSA